MVCENVARRGGACLDTEIRVKVEFDAKIKTTSAARRGTGNTRHAPRRRQATEVMRVTECGVGEGPLGAGELKEARGPPADGTMTS